jgi:hypothetical protein
VEIFGSNHEALSAHGRLKGTGQFSTDERHYPEEKVSLARFDVCMALREAERIGPQMQKWSTNSCMAITHCAICVECRGLSD